MKNLIMISQIITFTINFSFGFFVLRKNFKNTINIFYSIFSISLALWSLSIFLIVKQAGPQLILSRLGFSFALIMTASILYFSLIFPENKKQKNLIKLVLAITTTVLLIFTFTDAIVINVNTSNGHIQGELGKMLPLFSVFSITSSFASLFIFLYKYKKSSGRTKSQLAYVIFGFSFFLITSHITNLILPIFGFYKLNNLGPIFSIPMIIMISIAIVRHNLMDIRIIIQKSLIYTILLSLITITYLLLISIVGYFFQKTTNTAVIISAIFTTVLGIFTVPRIEEIFCRMTDKIFFKDKYNYGEAIHQLSQVLNKNIEPEELLEKTMTTLKTILRVKDVKIILKDHAMFTENGLESNDEENIDDLYQVSRRENFNTLIRSEIPYLLENAQEKGNTSFVYVLERAKKFSEKYGTEIYTLVPINEDIIAIIASGEKKSGDPYSDDDFRLLDTFSNQMAVALSKADLYKKVKNHSLDLEKKVAHRTSEIRKLQEEQERMILDISHGLQTPLTIIRGELEFLQAQTGNRKLKDFEKSIDNISKFIYDLLTLSKLQSNTQNMRMEDLDLSEIVEILVDYFPTLVQDKNIEIKHHIEPNILMHGNKNKLEELVNNLVSNSIKYIGHGNFISISLFRRGSSIILEIEDNGIGIAEKDLPHIFERFYRANTKTKGSGLGLAICREIANKHNGKIRVESELGKWTKFTITLKNSSNVL